MGRNLRVLYVDDEPAMLDVGRIFLESGNAFSVDTLTSAREALEHLKTEQYDVIISDYQMPEMNGIMFLKQLKQTGNTTPFIIFTGRGREEVVIEALNEGADFYLQKGGEPRAQFTELANKIRYAVTRRRAEEGLRESEERYRHVVEDQTEFICRFLPDGTHIFVNDAYCRYFGLDREEILGSLFRPTIHPEDRKDVARVLASLTPDHPLDTIDQRILMPDGSIRWQRWVDRAIFHEDGTLKEYQSVGRDITEYKQSEEALRDSEAKYRTVFETTGTAMVLIEEDATISLVNSEFERLSGYAKEEIENRKKWTEFVVQEDLDRMLDQHHLRRKDRQSALTHYEFRFRTRSGDIRNIFLTIDVIPDTAQSIASLLDISDRKMIEEVLRDRLETERTLINSPADMAVLLDVNGIILNINDHYAGVLGNTPRNLLGVCLWDLTPPGVKDSRRNYVDQAIRSKDVVRFEEYWKNRWYDILVNPILSDRGDVIRVAVTARNITERKQAEQMLLESEAEFRDFFHNAGDAMVIHDMEGNFLEVNEVICRRLGYSREELLGMSAGSVDHPDYGKRVPARIRELQETGHIVFETEHCAKDGTCIPTEVSSRLITYKGKPAVISTGRDITERKRAEVALRQAGKKLNLLSGITRHDIRNQLLVLNGFVELLNIEVPDPAFDTYFSRIKAATGQIESMIRFTQEYEKIGIRAPAWQHLHTLVEEAGKCAPLGHVTLTNDLPANTEILADPLIQKVFFNLIENAVRHGGGTITRVRFSFETRNGEGIVACEDDGAGIPAEKKEKIFEPGFGENTGLGLALSREILGITGITITEAGDPGRGARFEIRVPRGMYRKRGR